MDDAQRAHARIPLQASLDLANNRIATLQARVVAMEALEGPRVAHIRRLTHRVNSFEQQKTIREARARLQSIMDHGSAHYMALVSHNADPPNIRLTGSHLVHFAMEAVTHMRSTYTWREGHAFTQAAIVEWSMEFLGSSNRDLFDDVTLTAIHAATRQTVNALGPLHPAAP